MKKLILLCLSLALSLGVFAQTSGTGIGARIGTGLDFTARFWTADNMAFDVAAGLDFVNSWGVGLHADAGLAIVGWSWSVAQDEMKVYLGPGVGMGMYFNGTWGSYFDISLRAPSGVGYYFHSMPLECFAELTPYINFFDSNGFDLGFGSAGYVGARWYF